MKRLFKRAKKGTDALEFILSFPILYIFILFVFWAAMIFFFKCFAGTLSTEAVSRDSYSLGRGGAFISSIAKPFKANIGYRTEVQGEFILTEIQGSVSEDWLGWLGSRTSNFQTDTYAPKQYFKP